MIITIIGTTINRSDASLKSIEHPTVLVLMVQRKNACPARAVLLKKLMRMLSL